MKTKTHKQKVTTIRRISNCCSARPDGELALDNTGPCSKCKDGAVFESEYDHWCECGRYKVDADGVLCDDCQNERDKYNRNRTI